MKKIGIAFIIFLVTLFCWSCGKQVTSYVPVGTPFYYPAVYNFPNVNDSTQKLVLVNIDQLMAAINKGSTANTIVDTANLSALFNNTLLGFSLASLCTTSAQTDLLNYFDSVGVFSHSTVTGSDGIAGVGASTLQPGVSYLQSDSGFVFSELANAALMEGLIAYQIEAIHLGDSINTSKTTASLNNNWDAAFGYFAVPIDFPTDSIGSKYWGAYSYTLGPATGLDNTIMTNYLIGRAAIGNGYIIQSSLVPGTTNYSAIADADSISRALDKMVAGAAIHELGLAQTNDSLHDFVIARAHLSSSWGFIHSINYGVGFNNIAPVSAILAAYGTNLYHFNYSYENVDSLKTVIGLNYGFTTNTNF